CAGFGSIDLANDYQAGRAPIGRRGGDLGLGGMLVERETELAAIDDALHGTADGAGRTIVIESPPGKGKSRLLTVAGDLARRPRLSADPRVVLAGEQSQLASAVGDARRRRSLVGPSIASVSELSDDPAGRPTDRVDRGRDAGRAGGRSGGADRAGHGAYRADHSPRSDQSSRDRVDRALATARGRG